MLGLSKILKQMLQYDTSDRLSFKEVYQQVFEQNKLSVVSEKVQFNMSFLTSYELSSRHSTMEGMPSKQSLEEVLTKHNIMEMLDDVLQNNPTNMAI